MGLMDFFAANQAEWPLGRMHTTHQVHEIAINEPITHSLLADDFLKTADVIRGIVKGPKKLSQAAAKSFMLQVASIVSENADQGFHIKPDVSNDCIPVSILVATPFD